MRIKDMVFLSMLSALAFVSVMFIRIPIMPSAPFLRFDLKDCIIIIGGLLYGPLTAVIVSLIVG
ncbi:MAG: ECF transporter S component, partial [Synergistaceae bacterium]|nr:ECF transporter S component [Synergistaceae bacterium]